MLPLRKLLRLSPTVLALHYQQLIRALDCRLYHHGISKDENVDDSGHKFRNSSENAECHFQLHKSRGQHLLTSARVLDSIVKNSNIKSTDTVLEIGPGTGNLTLRLLEAATSVVAVEIDWRMAEALEKRVAECGFKDRLTLIRNDAMKTEFPHFDLVVANIPYGISSPLIAKLLFRCSSFRSATLLLQKEFAHRLLANPGDSEFNRLAVNVKLVADVEHIMDVSKRDFFPVPKVDSSVVLIRPKMDIPNVDLKEWCAFTRTCFSKKNKTLGATFKQKKKLAELMRISSMMGSTNLTSLGIGMSLFKDKVVEILRSNGFEDKRPSKLSIEELLHLLSLLNQHKIYFHDKKEDADKDDLETISLLLQE
ncbi:ribosomal RNA small subunit methyltransferase, mitochondrial [Amaranthus tricolor]|uniref:ribosomal RNA small subunit methyltransferase, mitochondrial n=1 Tax=Amaranthus tricolor TaxID=29722 RepID=UPI00258B6B4C|nr:ribosomal RNA small subunit methyltransferase, mitochondrial [Amaranthus tricolor]XP_057530417.1 ribosomal RNA small subunit methyltransferase, mitochondrial [Amaranthus tricolor]